MPLVVRDTIFSKCEAIPQGCACSTAMFGLCLLVAVACGGGGPGAGADPCGEGTCEGCCDAAGRCLPGLSLAACGTHGAHCAVCGRLEACSAGRCVVAERCDALSCGGCCVGDTCLAGDEGTACGRQGQACDVCGRGLSCVAGICAERCDARSCPDGCCAGGRCIAGVDLGAQFCGAFGEACAACRDGEGCVEGWCRRVACGADTCEGCCDAAGNCQLGAAETSCGAGGKGCVACAGGEGCSEHSCVTVNVGCNGATCAGCCDEMGRCREGQADLLCGSGGVRCASCGGTRECIDGTCRCSTDRCPGCCQGEVCKSGTSDGACGAAGESCSACEGARCTAGSCAAASCNALSCSGCCDASGTCVEAPDAARCGLFGSACERCAAGSVCQFGSCNDATRCNGTTCATGCCQDGVCWPGNDDSGCGANGDTCERCGEHLYCERYLPDLHQKQLACIPRPGSIWDVFLETVRVKEGVAWDHGLEGAAPPDVFVWVSADTRAFQSDVFFDRYHAVVNAFAFSASAAELAKGLRYEVRDRDLLSADDPIAVCERPIYPLALKAGVLLLTGCPGAPDNRNLISVVFRFALRQK